MSARRCSTCNINYPYEKTYKKCLACDEPTWSVKDDTWDANWPSLVKQVSNGADIASGVKPIPNVVTTIFQYEDMLWIAEEILEAEGYTCNDFVIVKINDNFYELQGRKDGEVPAWWIEPVRLEWPKHLTVLSEPDYAALEIKRGLRT